MRIWVIAIGRLKAGPEGDLAADYVMRAQGLGRAAGIRDVKIVEYAESKAATPALRKVDEARLIAGAVPADAHTIALDERGKAQSSADFAKLIQRHLDGGTTDMAFLIGGPDGHDEPTLRFARQTLSFGPMTWPHRLVRIMLAEQIYRAVTIMVNHPYHRP